MREQWHQGRVAVVTGGHTGIGLAIAHVLVSRGATVVIGGRRLADPGLAAGLQAETGAIALALDVTDPVALQRAMAGRFAVLSACPFHITRHVAQGARDGGVSRGSEGVASSLSRR